MISSLLKFQITNHKLQTNPKSQNTNLKQTTKQKQLQISRFNHTIYGKEMEERKRGRAEKDGS